MTELGRIGSDVRRSGRVGIADSELVDALSKVLRDRIGPTCIVSRRAVPSLNSYIAQLESIDGSTNAPVTADRLRDVPSWMQQQDGPVTIVVYLMLWERKSNNAALATLREIAPVDSRLVVVEPTLGVGLASFLQRVGRQMFKRRVGLSFHRDIPAEIRTAGWQLTTVQRLAVGAPASVMTFVVAEARVYE